MQISQPPLIDLTPISGSENDPSLVAGADSEIDALLLGNKAKSPHGGRSPTPELGTFSDPGIGVSCNYDGWWFCSSGEVCFCSSGVVVF